MRVILASGSPRRRELLKYIRDDFEIMVADADETVKEGTAPEEAVVELACRKASAVRELENARDAVIIAADTIVVLDGRIYGKPADKEDCARMLSELSGRVHTVLTGVCIVTPEGKTLSFFDSTQVEFYKLGEKEIACYIATDEPMDKAGGYAIQGQGAMLVKGIVGDFYNVIGLPIAKLKRMADMIGVSL